MLSALEPGHYWMVIDTSLRPGSVCTEVFQELMITFIAQPVQGVLQDIAKGPTTGEACLQRLQDEEGIRANPFWCSVLGGALPRGGTWSS